MTPPKKASSAAPAAWPTPLEHEKIFAPVHRFNGGKCLAVVGYRGRKSPPPDLQRVGGRLLSLYAIELRAKIMGCALKASRCPTACEPEHGARAPFSLTLSGRAVTGRKARAACRAARRRNFALLLKVRVLARSRASVCQTARHRFMCIAMHGRRIHPRDSGRFSGSKTGDFAGQGVKTPRGPFGRCG